MGYDPYLRPDKKSLQFYITKNNGAYAQLSIDNN